MKPFIGGQELINLIEGKIRLEEDVIYTFSGHWDDEIILVDRATNVSRNNFQIRLKKFSELDEKYLLESNIECYQFTIKTLCCTNRTATRL